MMRTATKAAALALSLAVVTTGLATTSAHAQCGGASWYSLPGNKTANGERMNPSAMTAAHKTLPFGTKVKVKNQRNGKEVIVRINDRGPFIKGRVLDLSKSAAAALGFVRSGHTKVCMEKTRS